jgi:large subunit ribosomal protein L33
MAGKSNRENIKLRSTESSYTYYVSKNKRNTPAKLELKKYDPIVRKHVLFKEVR